MAEFNIHRPSLIPKCAHSQLCEVTNIDVSNFAEENLYYVICKGESIVHFPFSADITPTPCYLVLLTEAGQGILYYQESSYLLESNKIIFVPCYTGLHIEINQSNSWDFKLLFINGNNIDIFSKVYAPLDSTLCTYDTISKIPTLFSDLFNETEKCSTENDFIISRQIVDLLTELILTSNKQQSDKLYLPTYLVEIKKMFDLSYNEHFSLNSLEKKYHISKYKIIKDFEMYLHTSPINYLINKRMEVAKKLLEDTEYPIYEIALRVGIDNINHFTNLFKRITLLTPGKYRTQYRQKNKP